ncbi:MAG: hypothetical protein NVS2B7_02520 [Herpetosiphon sp.]
MIRSCDIIRINIRPRLVSTTAVTPWALLPLVWGIVLAVLSSARYTGYNAGMLDLGNMLQAISSVARGGPLITTGSLGTNNRLGGHAEVIYYLLGVVYRLWSDPRAILGVQGLLAASGGWAVALVARRQGFERNAVCLFAGGYLLMPTAVAAVLFDIHGDTFAMPVLAWLLAALVYRRWTTALLLAVAASLCKFYIVAPLTILGFSLMRSRTAPFDLGNSRHRRIWGACLVILSVAYGLFVLEGLHSWFRPVTQSVAYGQYYFGHFRDIGWFGLLDRLFNLAVVLLPAALLWRKSIWTALPAFAIIVPAMLSTGPGNGYAWSYHHYAAAVPFLVFGAMDGVKRSTNQLPSIVGHQRRLQLSLLFFGAVLIFHMGLSDTPLGVRFWLSTPGTGLDPSGYGQRMRDRIKDRWLEQHVPTAEPIAASNFLAPHLAQRSILYLLRYPEEAQPLALERHLGEIHAAFGDALFDYVAATGDTYVGGATYDHSAIQLLLNAPRWGVVSMEDGLIAFKQDAQPQELFRQKLTVIDSNRDELFRISEKLAVLKFDVTILDSRRWHITTQWRALQAFSRKDGFIVSRVEGVPGSRTFHLPFNLLGPERLAAGQVVEEQFDMEVPVNTDAASATIAVGLYDPRQPFAYATDARSLIGHEYIIKVRTADALRRQGGLLQ